jgi:hypothetical protein
MLAGPALAENVTISSVQLERFQGATIGARVQDLVYRGGLQLSSVNDTFGGTSGIGFTGPEGRLAMVSDRGNFIAGQLVYDERGAPLSLVGVTITPIQNSRGTGGDPARRRAGGGARRLRESDAGCRFRSRQRRAHRPGPRGDDPRLAERYADQ